MPRSDGRRADQMRRVTLRRNFVPAADGSCLISLGRTQVICTASIASGVPKWLEGQGTGWITAEYAMLPASTGTRKERRAGGREIEIQRLIGRSLRAAARLEALNGLTCTVDCDVLQADGGTRTAAITGGYVALSLALWKKRKLLQGPQWPLSDAVVATSVGLVDGRPVLDLAYAEDSAAEVDMNVVMTAGGRFVEVQASGEEHTFSDRDLSQLLVLARRGCRLLAEKQAAALPPALRQRMRS